MADPESSDVLANLPTGRPARRSSRRTGTPGGSGATASAAEASPAAKTKTPAPRATATKAPAKRSTPAKTAAKATPTKAAAAKAKTAAAPAAKAKTAAAKPAAKATPTKTAPAAKAKPTPAAKAKPTAAKAATAKAAAPKATAKAPARAAQQRRPRIATPTEGRRADFSAGSAMHRARKVTTNRPWLPSSGFALPDSKERPALGTALEGLAAALGDVARLSFGVAQSITARGKREEIAPTESEQPEPTKS